MQVIYGLDELPYVIGPSAVCDLRILKFHKVSDRRGQLFLRRHAGRLYPDWNNGDIVPQGRLDFSPYPIPGRVQAALPSRWPQAITCDAKRPCG